MRSGIYGWRNRNTSDGLGLRRLADVGSASPEQGISDVAYVIYGYVGIVLNRNGKPMAGYADCLLFYDWRGICLCVCILFANVGCSRQTKIGGVIIWQKIVLSTLYRTLTYRK